MNRYRMYINGEFVDSRSDRWFSVYDSSTEEVTAGPGSQRTPLEARNSGKPIIEPEFDIERFESRQFPFQTE